MRAILLLLCAALTSTASAAELNFKQDGWYRWEVPAGRGGQNACCYRFSGDTVKLAGCRLGDGMDEFSPAGECDVTSDSMQIFVEVSNGRVREIRPLSSNCPVKTHFEVRTIEDVTTAESINWLRREIYENGTEADEAIMTLSFHSEAQALGALFEILEDTDLRHDAREQALFWLVQTDSDEAYAYLDKLLD
jgi:hypothetical protein